MKRAIMVFAASLALLAPFLGVTNVAWAANAVTGHRFCDVPLENPEDFRARLRESRARDASGNAALRGCRASANHFLAAYRYPKRLAQIREIIPNLRLDTLDDLDALFARMVELDVDVNTEYETDSLLDRPGGGYIVAYKGQTRHPRDREKIFGLREVVTVDGQTKTAELGLMMSNCVNPGATPVEIVVTGAKCLRIEYEDVQGLETRLAHIDSQNLPGECNALELAGESQRRDGDNFPDDCRLVGTYEKVFQGRVVKVVCDWFAIEANSSQILKRPVQVTNVSAGYKAKGTGTSKWFLPRAALKGHPTLCFEMPDGTYRTVSVPASMFVNGVAKISREQVEAAVYTGGR